MDSLHSEIKELLNVNIRFGNGKQTFYRFMNILDSKYINLSEILIDHFVKLKIFREVELTNDNVRYFVTAPISLSMIKTLLGIDSTQASLIGKETIEKILDENQREKRFSTYMSRSFLKFLFQLENHFEALAKTLISEMEAIHLWLWFDSRIPYRIKYYALERLIQLKENLPRFSDPILEMFKLQILTQGQDTYSFDGILRNSIVKRENVAFLNDDETLYRLFDWFNVYHDLSYIQLNKEEFVSKVKAKKPFSLFELLLLSRGNCMEANEQWGDPRCRKNNRNYLRPILKIFRQSWKKMGYLG